MEPIVARENELAAIRGFIEAVKCVGSYVWVRVRPPEDQTNLEGFYADWLGRPLPG